jgi:hypothetical protein
MANVESMHPIETRIAVKQVENLAGEKPASLPTLRATMEGVPDHSLYAISILKCQLCGGFAIFEVFGKITGRGTVPANPKRLRFLLLHDATRTKPSSRC